jgi:drug/metabolite transporter (DMT)-like permease
MTTTNALDPSGRPAIAPRTFVQRIPAFVLFGFVATCWGMNSVTMKVTGRTVPPLTVATARALLGGGILLLVARRTGADWPRSRQEWTGLAWIAFLMTGLSTAGLFLAAKNAPAGLVSIFSNLMPLFTAMFAPVLLNEKISRRVVVGLLVGLSGAVIVASRAIHGEIKPMGVVFGLVGAITAALGSIMYKRFPLKRLDRLMVVAVQLLLSSVVLGVLAVPENRSHMRFPWQFKLSFVYLTFVGLAMSFVLWSELLSRSSSMQSSAVAYLATVIGVVAGAVLLGERLSATVLVGGVVAIAGVAIVQLDQLRR